MQRADKYIESRLLSKVSTMYYDQNYNQQEIADRLNLSRPKVSRLLKQAREVGIVQITVVSSNETFVELENTLEEMYGLKEALIVEVDEQISEDGIKKQIGSAAVDYLYRTISEGEMIGMTWGTTLQAMVDAMLPKEIDNIHVVQAMGGVGPPEAKAHAADISRRFSRLLNSQLTLLPTPGIVGSIEAKEVLLSDRQVKNALDLISQIDTFYVGIGALETNPILGKRRDELPDNLYEELITSDTVGDVALRFFDKDGKEVHTRLNDLLIGITLQEIKQIDTVVGIAGGLKKVEAIRGALRGKFIDVLITDNHVASQLTAE